MIRIVKMTFKEEYCDDFLQHFETIKHKIAARPGCKSLRLHQDINDPTVFFTYSDWQADSDLQHYRQSPLFIDTWKKVKMWFSEKAAAWSVDTKFDSTC